MTTTKPASTYHHGDLPTALLKAVGEIVEEKGAAAVTLREARAGQGSPTPLPLTTSVTRTA